jgi:hypothetical protein
VRWLIVSCCARIEPQRVDPPRLVLIAVRVAIVGQLDPDRIGERYQFKSE